jgi:hypothetical protein
MPADDGSPLGSHEWTATVAGLPDRSANRQRVAVTAGITLSDEGSRRKRARSRRYGRPPAADLTACIAPELGDLRGMDSPAKCPHMVDMEVIVRLQDRGAQRFGHLHDQALCGPKGASNRRSPNNAAERAMSCSGSA